MYLSGWVVSSAVSESARRTFVTGMLGFGIAAIVHAAVTWSVEAAFGFLVVAVGSAFVMEWLIVRLGALVHHTQPAVRGVPVAVLAGWVGATYLWYRVAVLVVGVSAVTSVIAATLATAADASVDHRGVEAGLWTYHPRTVIPGPQIRGVPWWNFAGWFVLTFLSALSLYSSPEFS